MKVLFTLRKVQTFMGSFTCISLYPLFPFLFSNLTSNHVAL